jgi:hypothetical protein
VKALEETLHKDHIGDNPGENPDVEEGAKPDPRWCHQRVYDRLRGGRNSQQLEREKRAAQKNAQEIRRFKEETEACISAVRDRLTEAEQITARRIAAADEAVRHDRISRTGWFGWK